jgi:uncharacterized protein YndB with AHSA1/START domain
VVEERRVGALALTTPSDSEIVMTRNFDAPRELVFDVLTNPERFVLRGPDGTEMGMSGVYREITPPERLVSTESYDDYPGESLNTVTLSDDGGTTTLTVTILYPSKEVRDAVLESGMQDGAAETYDRLAEYLATIG